MVYIMRRIREDWARLRPRRFSGIQSKGNTRRWMADRTRSPCGCAREAGLTVWEAAISALHVSATTSGRCRLHLAMACKHEKALLRPHGAAECQRWTTHGP